MGGANRNQTVKNLNDRSEGVGKEIVTLEGDWREQRQFFWAIPIGIGGSSNSSKH